MSFFVVEPNWWEVGFRDQENRLDRPFPGYGLWVPAKIEFDKKRERLLWWWQGSPGLSEHDRLVDVPDDLLGRFVDLGGDGEPTAEEVLALAAAVGPLDIWDAAPAEEWKAFRAKLPRGCFCGEPISTWGYFVQAMHSALQIAACLKLGTMPKANEWRSLGVRIKPPASSGEAMSLLTDVINQWLRMTGVGPAFVWDPTAEVKPAKTPTLYMDAGSVLGFLALQLAQVVAGIKGWGSCITCGRLFAVLSRRRTDRCAKCAKLERWRRASARYSKTHPVEHSRKAKAHAKASRKSRR